MLPCLVASLSLAKIETQALDLTPPLVQPAPIALKDARSPDGHVIGADTQSLTLDGKRVIWTMGEFHYARYPESEWKQELLKMKAGGIDIVSTYVFWIHHEEVEGHWDWSGQRNLRKFLQTCKEVGLKAFVRGGPWAHGECRNGGFPDWIAKHYKTRTDDPAYMGKVGLFYDEIAKQMKGMAWAEGGPVIGFQVENEYGGPGAYLVKLKKMAESAGIHVPLWTRTGWPTPSSPVPAGELFPMYGGYPVGFWDRGTEETAAKYARTFIISTRRNPDDILEGRFDGQPAEQYPYLCCEIGAGMEVSYHRRVYIEPDEVGSLAMVKIASGNNLEGYYMYHGGTNPDGKLTKLNETQATGYWNDVPVKSYDFQTALGECGEVRPQFHILRRMHLFLHDFGAQLAGMPATVASDSPVRWSARSDGKSGFIFVNNFERLRQMPAQPGTQFRLSLQGGELTVPEQPVTVPANSYFYWPFNIDLGGAKLVYATAQPVCRLDNGKTSSFFFAETVGVPAEFAFDGSTVESLKAAAGLKVSDKILHCTGVKPGLKPALTCLTKSGRKVEIFLLSANDSLRLYKGRYENKERAVLSDGVVLVANDSLDSIGAIPFEVCPPDGATTGGSAFASHIYVSKPEYPMKVYVRQIAQAGVPVKVSMGSQGVAEQPSDAAFEKAAAWEIKLDSRSWASHGTLQFVYRGDVARLYLDGKLIEDSFCNGRPMDVDLGRYKRGKLVFKILPLRADSPVYFNPGKRPDFGGATSVCRLVSVGSKSEPRW